ncbi:Uncharacterised protein [Pannonibacter phragmitetus]|jgi:hypothetical protein|uniref:Uncharacterized protein n=1 Tax=Pannonibacter phragmitetus TaxID=121719 RepID=A0A378ZVV2_9HYPH|nr:Uncharacterised protein [Pannonibacter phragmitetus]
MRKPHSATLHVLMPGRPEKPSRPLENQLTTV